MSTNKSFNNDNNLPVYSVQVYINIQQQFEFTCFKKFFDEKNIVKHRVSSLILIILKIDLYLLIIQ